MKRFKIKSSETIYDKEKQQTLNIFKINRILNSLDEKLKVLGKGVDY